MSCLPLASKAATVISTDAKEFQGEMIAATINTVTINDQDGGYTIVPRKEILEIKVDIRGSDRLTGQFHDWQDGICVLRVQDRLVGVQDGLVTFIMSAEPTAALPSGGPKNEVSEEPKVEVRQKQEPPVLEEEAPAPSDASSPLDNLGPAHRIQM